MLTFAIKDSTSSSITGKKGRLAIKLNVFYLHCFFSFSASLVSSSPPDEDSESEAVFGGKLRLSARLPMTGASFVPLNNDSSFLEIASEMARIGSLSACVK